MKSIILIGYRCTGKTSVGKRLAEKLELPFYDTDPMITDRFGKSIKAWVEEKGWDSFRQEEKAVIKEIACRLPGVISLGGGAVMDPENRELLRPMGLIVWMTADVGTILTRMKSDPHSIDNRPHLSDKDWENETREILTQRSPIYRQSSDFSIDTEGKTVEVIAEELVALVKRQGILGSKGPEATNPTSSTNTMNLTNQKDKMTK
jgi:shikimate kinase